MAVATCLQITLNLSARKTCTFWSIESLSFSTIDEFLRLAFKLSQVSSEDKTTIQILLPYASTRVHEEMSSRVENGQSVTDANIRPFKRGRLLMVLVIEINQHLFSVLIPRMQGLSAKLPRIEDLEQRSPVTSWLDHISARQQPVVVGQIATVEFRE